MLAAARGGREFGRRRRGRRRREVVGHAAPVRGGEFRRAPRRTNARGAECLTGTPTPQPATPPMPFGARPGPTRGMRAARRGTAFVRMLLLVGFTGFLVGGRARHRVRRPRHRHQRPTAVTDAGPVARAAELAALGSPGPPRRAARDRLLVALDDDDDPRVRAAALGALVRAAPDDAVDTVAARARRHRTGGASSRRRARAGVAATDVARRTPRSSPRSTDADVTVVEAAAWALGELGDAARAAGAVAALADVTRDHRDALAREAAVAALGALGDPDALPAILDACHDKPAVRRRAVLALAPFDGPEVDAAIAAALDRPRLAGPPGRRRPRATTDYPDRVGVAVARAGRRTAPGRG